MEWNGAKNNSTFSFCLKEFVSIQEDTLKPAKFMEDMTYDMAGSATVVGLMKSLALRKAKVNVGVKIVEKTLAGMLKGQVIL